MYASGRATGNTPPTQRPVSSMQIQGGSKNKLLILSEYVNETEKTGGT